MRVYISGPITGVKGFMRKFDWAEACWRDKGIYTINPARTNATLPEETDHDGYMRISMALLKECDTIYMLKGWESSEGANEERDYALENNYNVLYEERMDKITGAEWEELK